MSYRRCYAEISLDAVRNNLKNIKAAAGKDQLLLAVVKANAYGHGAVQVAKAAEEISDWFGVACLEEARELRLGGIQKPILILGYTSPKQYEELVELGVTPAVYSEEDARSLSECAQRLQREVSIHIALDTGMTRIGFRVNDENVGTILKIRDLEGIRIEGVFTHLSCADGTDSRSVEYTRKQIAEFEQLLSELKDHGLEIPIPHFRNSAGILTLKPGMGKAVRSGIITYGMTPSEDMVPFLPELEAPLSWYAHVIHVAQVEKGRGVSYGATYETRKPVTRIATVSAGYADGYPRRLSNSGRVLIRGKEAKIIGRVCMDQFMVDVSDIPDIRTEDRVTLIGKDGGEQITAEEIAALDGTINYEVTCRISPRVQRIYL